MKKKKILRDISKNYQRSYIGLSKQYRMKNSDNFSTHFIFYIIFILNYLWTVHHGEVDVE